MAANQLFGNNANSTLAGAITNTSLTAQLASGGGALFPHPAANQYFIATLIDEATGLLNEIVKVTSVVDDTVTMVRAQENTEAQAWNAGDLFQLLLTAGGCTNFAQEGEVQAGATNFGIDTGVANAYVAAFSPPLTAHLPGAPLWVQIANANTGSSTFNDGAGTLPIINPDGTALGSGTFTANGIYCLMNDGNGHFQMLSTSDEALSSQGVLQTGDLKWRPTAETLSGYVAAAGPTATIGNPTSGATLRANADTFNLFSWLWTNFSNTQCPVLPTGRGASALADFNSNKTIGVLDMRGKVPGGMDNMAAFASTNWSGVPAVSGNSTTAGSVLGQNTHTLTAGEIPAISSGASNGIGVSGSVSGQTAGFSVPPFAGTAQLNTGTFPINEFQSGTTLTPAVSASGSMSGTNSIGVSSTNTGGAAHNTAQLTMIGSWYLKL